MNARVFARVSARVLPLWLVVAAGCTVAAQAQTLPWPTSAPAPTSAAPWPSQQPAGPATPATLPTPGSGMQAPGTMMGGPGPSPEQQKCMNDFQGYRQDVEKRARAAEAESKKKPTREKMCELVSAYSAAEAKWLKFSEANMVRCGIPKQALEQIKSVHLHTADAKKKLCSAGPGGGAPAAPSLSDALGASLQPVEPPKKRQVGGTMDTLTGNVLTR